MAKGYIYCISNRSFKENIYKIGFTTKNLEKRIDCLYNTGVPTAFQINFAKMVRNCRQTEHEIHDKLKRVRINPSREFFKCSLSKIKRIFDSYEGHWWSEDATMVNQKKGYIQIDAPILKKSFNLRSEKQMLTNTPKKIKIVKKSKKRIILSRKVNQCRVNYKV